MADNQQSDEQQPRKKGVNKTGLLLGAAGLFLFLVGVKRTFRVEGVEPPPPPAPPADRSGDDPR